MSYRVAVYRHGMKPIGMEFRDGTPVNGTPRTIGNISAFNDLVTEIKGGYLTLYTLDKNPDAPYISAGMNGGVDTWNGGGVPELVFVGEGTHFGSMQWDGSGNPV